uniref:Uncharacterized protein n=1 Tax=Parascaris equorum TaxID=6256 RepID=A0A914RMR4_PAREQ
MMGVEGCCLPISVRCVCAFWKICQQRGEEAYHFPMAPLAPGSVPPNGAPNAGPYRGQPMAHPAHMVIPAHMLPEGIVFYEKNVLRKRADFFFRRIMLFAQLKPCTADGGNSHARLKGSGGCSVLVDV